MVIVCKGKKKYPKNFKYSGKICTFAQQMIKFSIITCTFNASEVIERTLQSVQEQSYHNLEHIIIDGVSRDNTMKAVNHYASSRPGYDIRVISERDKGLYDAMNKGIAMADGDYIVFLNAGDKLHNSDTLNLMAEQVSRLDTLPGVIYGNTDIVDDEGRFLHKRRLAPPEHLTWRSFADGMLVCHQSFYVLTDIAKRNLYDLQYRFSADVDWCIRVMKDAYDKGLTLHNTHLTLTSYLEGGMSVKNHRASLIERFRIMQKHYGLIKTIMKHFSFILRNV